MDETFQPVKCPHCGRLTDPGRFCQRCGKLLPDAADMAPAGAARNDPAGGRASGEPPPQLSAAPDAEAMAGFREDRLARTLDLQSDPSAHSAETGSRGGLPSSLVPPGVEAGDLPASRLPGNLRAPSPAAIAPIPDAEPRIPRTPIPSPAWHPHPRCPLLVEYNFARAFVVGHMYPFQFQIRALHENIERVAICLRGTLDGNPLPPDQEITVELSRDYAAPWDITFAPTGSTPGAPAVRIYIGWQVAGGADWQWMQASVRHCIYPAQISARELASSLVVNITTNVENNGHANDANTRVCVDQLDQLARRMDHDGKAFALVDQLAALQLFKPLNLLPSKMPFPPLALPDPPPPREARLTALTLARGNWRLHVLGQTAVRFGRRREENDLVLRVFGPGNKLDEEASRLISKSHGCIEHQGHRCLVRDQSALGTALDGRRLRGGETAALAPSGAHCLTLAAAPEAQGRGNQWDLTTFHCGHAPHPDCPHDGNCPATAPASLHIRRRDGLDESYLVVWRCAPLDKLLPELAGARLYRVDGGFKLRRPGQGAQWLVPGRAISLPGGDLAVTGFQQLGLSSHQGKEQHAHEQS